MVKRRQSLRPTVIGPCLVCGRNLPPRQMRSFDGIRPGVGDEIARDHPEWTDGGYICHDDLRRYRRRYIERLLEDERGELSEADRDILESLETGRLLSQDPEEIILEEATFGERMADHVAAFGGSWAFIIGFGAVLAVWMALNVTGILFRPFDPYPFILLNLVLSTLAAIQAPVIMMSQRRQEHKDRLRAENDYRVNLKAELEIRQLHEKIDNQLARQWEKLVELQRIQIEVLEERR